MSKSARSYIPANKTAPPIEQQRLIAAQTEAFLAGGGQIQQIPNGVSGQAALGGPSLRTANAKAT